MRDRLPFERASDDDEDDSGVGDGHWGLGAPVRRAPRLRALGPGVQPEPHGMSRAGEIGPTAVPPGSGPSDDPIRQYDLILLESTMPNAQSPAQPRPALMAWIMIALAVMLIMIPLVLHGAESRSGVPPASVEPVPRIMP